MAQLISHENPSTSEATAGLEAGHSMEERASLVAVWLKFDVYKQA